MKKKTRTILFISCLLAFLLLSPGVVLYSQGYRFDFEEKEITTKGGFYCRVLPRKADLYINGQPVESTSIFSNSIFLNNLTPGEYQIETKKEGYHSWQKTLEVKERQVTEAKNIILFPEEISYEDVLLEEAEAILEKMEIKEEKEAPEILEEIDFKDFFISPDKNKIAYILDKEVRVLFLNNNYSLSKLAGEESLIPFKVKTISWLDSYHLLLVLGNKIMVSEIDDRDNLNIVDLIEIKNPEIYWDKDQKTLYLLSQDILYKISNLIP